LIHFSNPRKPLLLLATLAASVSLVACGGGDDTTSASSDTASTPEAATEAFLTAIANGDGAAACALASADALDTIESQQDGSCEDAVVASAGQVSEQDKKDVADATFEVTDQTDTTATVTATKPDGQAQTFNLVLEDGEWKVNE
jgi:hypothetical protein